MMTSAPHSDPTESDPTPHRPAPHLYRTPGCCGLLNDAMHDAGLDLVDTPLPEHIYNQGSMVIFNSMLIGTNLVNLATKNSFPHDTVVQGISTFGGPAIAGLAAAVFSHAISDIVCSEMRMRPSVAKWISAGVQVVTGTAAAALYLGYGIGGSNPHP